MEFPELTNVSVYIKWVVKYCFIKSPRWIFQTLWITLHVRRWQKRWLFSEKNTIRTQAFFVEWKTSKCRTTYWPSALVKFAFASEVAVKFGRCVRYALCGHVLKGKSCSRCRKVMILINVYFMLASPTVISSMEEWPSGFFFAKPKLNLYSSEQQKNAPISNAKQRPHFMWLEEFSMLIRDIFIASSIPVDWIGDVFKPMVRI